MSPEHTSPWVLDTNTVMALWVFEDPALRTLRKVIAAGGVRLASRDDALEELRRVLAYSQFALTAARQQALFDGYAGRCTRLSPSTDGGSPLPRCGDPDDQKFLEIGRDAAASHVLTRDKLLLKLGRHRLIRPLFRIVTPEALQRDFTQPSADYSARR